MKTDITTPKRMTRCAKCGMPQTKWTGNLGEGIAQGDLMFCCEGCAHSRDCICDAEIREVDFQGID